MNIKDMVKNNAVRFVRYRKRIAYYIVRVPTENVHHAFPVPLGDIDDATLEAEDKAILFMRYIRQAIEDGTFVRAD